jgi:predicted CXXCH cytochrome family protein
LSFVRYKWAAGISVCLVLTAGLLVALRGGNRSVYLPGTTSAGHHQIENDCNACHKVFSGVEQESCLGCHRDELEGELDAHRAEKFSDPRDFWMLERIDARRCVTCHGEHESHVTDAMGVTLPRDFCFGCHADIAKERPSHAGFEPDGCAATGCHRYHDNRALYEDFIARHLDEPDTRTAPSVRSRNPRAPFTSAGRSFGAALTAVENDAPKTPFPDGLLADWAASSHAAAGVNCRDCHEGAGAKWTDRPPAAACKNCHELELAGFLASRHGMRLERGLSPMQPALARLPMKEGKGHAELGCGSCHQAHRFDTRQAAVEACVGCHDDRHSRSYEASPHARLWRAEVEGKAPPGSGVSCATCHLPRHTVSEHGVELVRVQHNQNDNLRPNDKFVRTVCLTCHGLGFSFDALADTNLTALNFRGRPSEHAKTLGMVKNRKAK